MISTKCKYYFLLCCFIISTFVIAYGCLKEQDAENYTKRFAVTQSVSFPQTNTNFHSINISMRKIDSLSAELNLRFTKKHAQGLIKYLGNLNKASF